MKPSANAGPHREPLALPCACANLRRAARIVTQLYDEALRPARMRATQFTLLQALVLAKGISQGKLADLLGMDSTTLTRTLSLLRRKGWIQSTRGADRRQIRLTLTADGARQYRAARPYWLTVQRHLRKGLGHSDWKRLITTAIRTAGLARKC